MSEFCFVTVRGCRVRVQSLGTGPVAVVFVPDPPNVLEHHAEAFHNLAREIRVVGLELPGFGFSVPRAGYGYSLREHADVLLAVLDELEVERAVLALSCAAGLISVAAASAAPERVAGIVGIQAADLEGQLKWSDRIDRRGWLRTPWFGQAFVRLNRRRIAKGWYDVALAEDGLRPDFLSMANQAFDRGGRYALASALQALAGTDEDVLLKARENVPALAVWGLEDRTHRHTDRGALRRYLPNLELVTLEKAGHFPELEAEPRFRKTLFAWMAKHNLA